MRQLTASLHLRVKASNNTFRYVPAVRNKDGSLREGYAIVGGQQEHHPEGIYTVRDTKSDGKRTYEAVGGRPRTTSPCCAAWRCGWRA